MTGRFEWHVTVDRRYRDQVVRIADALGFTFSEITGCPILGQGTYCYVTGYQTDYDEARQELDGVCSALLVAEVPPLRAKIEDIIYDTKTGVNRGLRLAAERQG